MKTKYFYFFLLLLFFSCENEEPMEPRYASLNEYPIYNGDDLGYQFSPEQTTFKLWAPSAFKARMFLYEKDLDGAIAGTHDLEEKENGVWTTTINENLEGKYFTFQTKVGDGWRREAPDPYSIACGTNGARTQIIDLSKTNPDGWTNDKRPPLAQPNDIIIYELHVRDLSISALSGIQNKGKFLGLTERGTTSPEGLSTGIDHLVEMGVTHLHLLPTFDFRSVDERKSEAERKYNWGYDPHLYNVPEGSYSTNPQDGQVRIKEFKQMVQALHQAGIRVVMDVVYNHTGRSRRSVFNILVPQYYYRQNEEGNFSDASHCGNETASERPMVRNFIVSSVKYWAEEYHIDGFRFDLMGIHDIETMNLVSKTLKEVDPTIFVYGEGWAAGDSPLAEEKRALKVNVPQLDPIAAFSDDIRDGLKGHVFTAEAKAFISGKAELEESVKFGIVAATQHPQVNYKAVNYSEAPWAKQPAQCINYVSCHDNHTLYDRLTNSDPKASEEDKEKMARLGLGTVLTSQGIPFLHAGSEFLRTKYGVENSYESSDSINAIDWSRKNKYLETVDFVKRLIQIRKAHPAFKMKTQEEIAKNLKFLQVKNNLITYSINGAAVGDSWKKIIVILNGNKYGQKVKIHEGNWKFIVRNGKVDASGIDFFGGGRLNVDPIEMIVLAQ